MDYVVSVTLPSALSLSFLLPSRKEPDLAVLGHPYGTTRPSALYVVDVPQASLGTRGEGPQRNRHVSWLPVTSSSPTVTPWVLSLGIYLRVPPPSHITWDAHIILWGNEFHKFAICCIKQGSFHFKG